jgi:diguanylate cyclase (GGDEF)-like protein/PAS domain S-box-containing protein
MPSRIFLKFLGIQLVAFLFIIALGLSHLAKTRELKAEEEFSARIGHLAARISSLVADAEQNQDREAANRYLNLLIADRGVLCAEVLDNGQPSTQLAAPRRVGCKGSQPSSVFEIPLPSQEERTLRIGLNSDEIAAVRRDFREFSMLLATGALLVAALASWLAFRRVIGRPLSMLLAGIRDTALSRSRRKVQKVAEDELGEVVEAFNEMQVLLEEESRQVETARDRVTRLYNATPAMLFTLNRRGQLTTASDFWLEVTGFSRSEVVGRHLSRSLSDASSTLLEEQYLPQLRQNGLLRGAPLTLVSKAGIERHVLFSAISDEQNGKEYAGFVCILTDVTDLKVAEERLRNLAWTDTLTGLPNRAQFADRLRDLVQLPAAKRGLSAIMMIDLDNFKWINDTYGHVAGDKLLIEAARRIAACIGKDDIVARLGGDEFAVICRDLGNEAQALDLASAIIGSVVEGIPLENAVGFVSASIGVVYLQPDDQLSSAALLRRADQAMYASKRGGKSRCEVYDERHGDDDRMKSERMQRIETALATNAFSLSFQPIVDLETALPVGVEALLRLASPEGRQESIQELIEVAEETGQMERLGNWILYESARHYAALAESSGNPEFYLSVNLSARQVTDSFAVTIQELFQSSPELRGRLVLEVTETAAVSRLDKAIHILNAVRAEGTRIAIDDLGTEYSSLRYVSSLPVDIIKLDRSFVSGFSVETVNDAMHWKRRALARIIATIGRELQLKVTAEGIETPEQAEQMRELGIRYGQGYGFSPPLPARECREWLALFGNVKSGNPGQNKIPPGQKNVRVFMPKGSNA